MMQHPWDVTIAEAARIQNELRERVQLRQLPDPVRTIAGTDLSFSRGSDVFSACVVVLAYPELTEIEYACAQERVTFPYVPGYLSFREIPTLLRAYEQLKTKPDVIMADGQGIAHPRRLGIATHLGLLLDVPTFGCAKSRLYGSGTEPADEKGSVSYLTDPKTDDVIGAYVRTKAKVKPVIISPGNRITLPECLALTLGSVRAHRLPEPTRRAHILVNAFRTGTIAAHS